MIQRIQTLWLLAAGACGFATLKLPFYIGSKGNAPAEPFSAMSSVFLLTFTITVSIVAFVTIFLFKNRSMQLKMGLAGLAASIITILLYFSRAKQYDTGGIALSSVFTFAIPVCYILALRGIYKDEKLVKNADRLR